MERPSHINFKTSHPFSRRLASLGLAVSLPLAVLWGLTHGMTMAVFHIPGPMVLVPTDDPVPPKTPPPDPHLKDIPRVTTTMPEIPVSADQDNERTIAPQPPSDRHDTGAATAGGPDSAAVGVVSTHTIPPYPMLALRVGAEGKVTLRLTVLTNGTVGKAEIVNSSGREDLDVAAEQWIVAHWIYKPALDKGQPAASQTVVSVVFSLRNTH